MTNLPRSGPTTACVVLGAAAILLLAAALFCYVSLDAPLLEQLASHPVDWQKVAWVNAFRQLGKALVPLWLVLLWTAVTGRSRPLVLTSVALILTMLMVVPLKGVTQRLRPSAVLAVRTQGVSPQELRAAARASFPSGDAATAFAVATAVACEVTWLAWPLLYVSAAGVAVLRVTGMNHFPSDVCAGAAAGILAGCLALWILAKVPRLAQLDLRGARPQGALACVAGAVLLGLVVLDPADPLPVFLKVFWPLVLLGGTGMLLLRSVARPRQQHP
jgi:undecaprenyl-diphosphatase